MNRKHLDVSKVEFIVTFIAPFPLFSFQGCKVTSVSAICRKNRSNAFSDFFFCQCLELRASQWDNDENAVYFSDFCSPLYKLVGNNYYHSQLVLPFFWMALPPPKKWTNVSPKPKWIIFEPLEFSGHTLPETNSSPLKMDGWNTIVPFWGPAYFQGQAVIGRVNPIEWNPGW